MTTVDHITANGTDTSDLEAHGVPDYQRRLITSVRCVVAAAAEPTTPLSAEGIARRTGLSQATVLEVLSSEEFRELLHQSTQLHCAAALNKGVHVTAQIMMNSKNESTRLAAVRSLMTLYKTLVEATPKHESMAGEEGILRLLEQLESTGGVGTGNDPEEPEAE